MDTLVGGSTSLKQYIIKQYEDQIQLFEQELATAHDEIRTLRSENRRLRLQLDPDVFEPPRPNTTLPLTPAATPERQLPTTPVRKAHRIPLHDYFPARDNDSKGYNEEYQAHVSSGYEPAIVTPRQKVWKAPAHDTKHSFVQRDEKYFSSSEEAEGNDDEQVSPSPVSRSSHPIARLSPPSLKLKEAKAPPPSPRPVPSKEPSIPAPALASPALSESDRDDLAEIDLRKGLGRPVPALTSSLPIHLQRELTEAIGFATNIKRKAELWDRNARSTACLISRACGDTCTIDEGKEGVACRKCENERRMCVQRTRYGRAVLVPLSKALRRGESGDMSFWVKNGEL